MSFFSRLIGKEQAKALSQNILKVDMHSHLLPGIDDGVSDFDESIEIIVEFVALGYKKLITTPHIMADFYRNTPEEINALCNQLNEKLRDKNIEMVIEPGAEYYLDENFESELNKKSLLSFGKENYVLVETSYISEPENFYDLIFKAKIAGYQPILAHPERYVFMYDSFERYKELFAKDILFQLNLGSLAGYYSREAKKIAEQLIKHKMVNFIGTDIHHTRHLPALKSAMQSPSFKQLTAESLLNNTLL